MSSNAGFSADVVIIGAGAGGSACAYGLTQRGLKVLVLEAGPAYDPAADYRLHKADWEQQLFPDKGATVHDYSFAPLQTLSAENDDLRSWNHLFGRHNPGSRRRGWRYHHVRGVGGSTLHFAGEAHRLHPEAFRLHSLHGVGADWPLTYADLAPYYQAAETLLGVAGPANDRRRRAPYPLPAHPMSYAGQQLARGAGALGLGWQANSLAILSRPHDGRPGCNYCANCLRGCPRRDKGSADVTFMHKALASGRCRVLTGCQALELVAGARDRVSEIIYMDAQGRRQRVAPQAVVLAAGAIETPRRLLLSANRHAPDGLANDSGQVGRHFMETLAWNSLGLHPDNLGSYRGLPADGICWDFNAPGAIPGIPGGCRFMHTTPETDMTGPVNYALRAVKGFGRAHKAGMRKWFGHALAVGAIGESLPHPQTFVDLDPARVDTSGRPVARIHSHLDALAIKRLRFMATTCRKLLHASGVAGLFEEYGSYDFFSATHVFGTCRMGRDPATSVVNSQCRSHRWQNLYIADASVFPSSGGGEAPSLTIEALALRCAAHLATHSV